MEMHGKDLFLSLKGASIGPFPDEILSGLHWEVFKNQHWAITGANGSGKTLLAEAIVGKRPLLKGKLEYHFFDEPDQAAYFIPDHHIGYVSYSAAYELASYAHMFYQQRFNAAYSEDFLLTRDVLKNVLVKSDNTIAQATIHSRIETVADLLGIQKDLLNRKIIKLSNGETKKLLLARALVRQPALLVLDDPFIGLDKTARQKLQEVINNIIKAGTHVMMVAWENEIPDAITHVLALEAASQHKFYEKSSFDARPRKKLFNRVSIKKKLLKKVEQKNEESFQQAVKFVDVTVEYDNINVLDHINWTVNRGEKWALQGGNGSGKSTLLSLIYGDNPQAYANEIYLFDKRRGSGESIWQIKNKTGFVSPEMHLYYPRNLTCSQVVQSGFTDTMEPISKLQPQESERMEVLFKMIGIQYLKNCLFSRIAMSEQRLVLLARALVKNPPMLIMDEPCQGLDVAHIQLIKQLLEEVCVSNETTLLYVTHYEAEIPDCVHSFLHLEKGKIINPVLQNNDVFKG